MIFPDLYQGAAQTFYGPWVYDREGHDKALANFRAIHGCEPSPLHNAFALYAVYKNPTGERAIMLMDAASLAAKLGEVGDRIAAAKAKHGLPA